MRKRSKAIHSFWLLGLLMSLVSSHALGLPADPTVAGNKATALSSAQQQSLNYFYLLKDPSLWNTLFLSPVQQVKLGVYEKRLDYLPVRFVSKGGQLDPFVTAMNTPQEQLKRYTDLGRVIADTLTERQRAAFQKKSQRLQLQPVEFIQGPKSITLVYRFGPRGRVTRSTTARTAKIGEVKRIFPSSKMAGLLKSFSDVHAAIFDEDNIVQAVGIRALSTLPMKNVDPKQKAAVARVLLELARSKELGVVKEDQLMTSLAKVVDASHKHALLELSKNASGIRLSGVVNGLSRTAPDEAVALACSLVDDGRAFAQAIDGFVMHGSKAEPHLAKLKKATKGKHGSLVQVALDRIRNKSTRSANKPLAIQRTQRPQQSIRMKAPEAKSGPVNGIENVSEWLESLRSTDFWEQSNALDRYERAKHKLNPGTLSHAEKSKLVKHCYARFKAEAPSILSQKYGRLLLDIADRDSIPLFEELASSKDNQIRVYGLAGLMKLSRKKAVEAGIKIESTALGIFAIVDAAKLVGPDSVPTLKELRSKLKEWSSQKWIDDTIKELR